MFCKLVQFIYIHVLQFNKQFNHCFVMDYTLFIETEDKIKHLFILDDDNRIILKSLTGRPDCQNDYINASYIEVCVTVENIHMCYLYIYIIGLLLRIQIHSYSR